MNIIYKNEISAEQVNCLRTSIGFRQTAIDQVTAGLKGSAFAIAAYNNNEIVGMSRLIWDGGIVALIRDVIILPGYKGQGIEQEMINRILEFLRSKLLPGHGIQVDVMAWNGDAAIFEDMGFCFSLPERRGVPMHICLSNQIEISDNKYKEVIE